MSRLTGHVALISGGARGQGAAEARLFAAQGAAVAICDLLEQEGEALASEIEALGGSARYFPLNVTSEPDWISVVSAIKAWKGKITILVNNAGIINRLGIVDTTLENWERVIAVNITGPYLGMKHVAPVMRDAGGGSIINIGSMASYMGLKCAAYTATKTGIVGLTRTAAMEFVGWNIRANTICPGTIVTGLNRGASHLEAMRLATPQKRYGTPEDIANLALFLASDESSHITGVDIPVDGGIVAGGAFHSIPLEPAKGVAPVRS